MRRGCLNPEKCSFRRPDGRCRTFRCSRCKRFMPWCQGADDNHPERCDDCWKPETEKKAPTLAMKEQS